LLFCLLSNQVLPYQYRSVSVFFTRLSIWQSVVFHPPSLSFLLRGWFPPAGLLLTFFRLPVFLRRSYLALILGPRLQRSSGFWPRLFETFTLADPFSGPPFLTFALHLFFDAPPIFRRKWGKETFFTPPYFFFQTCSFLYLTLLLF